MISILMSQFKFYCFYKLERQTDEIKELAFTIIVKIYNDY